MSHAQSVQHVRATTGQGLSIHYDAQTNTLIYVEDDWFSEGFRAGAVPPRTVIRERLATAKVTRLPRRKAA